MVPSSKERSTLYLVLRRLEATPSGEPLGEFEAWEPLRPETARSGADAIRQAARTLGHSDGTDSPRPGDYKAVPMRSWDGGLRITNTPKVDTDFIPLPKTEEVAAHG